jgi:AcrR family transcriptional regulator
MQPRSSIAGPSPKRADALRNYNRLLSAAREVLAERGPDAPLDDIAKRAVVGPGTLYRHFPARTDLLEAVFREEVEALTVRARELLTADDPLAALFEWLQAVVVHSTTYRGLAAAVMAGKLDGGADLTQTTHGAMHAAGAAMVDRARQSRQIRPDVTATDLLKLVNAIAWAQEQAQDSKEQTGRLMTIVLRGVAAQQ